MWHRNPLIKHDLFLCKNHTDALSDFGFQYMKNVCAHAFLSLRLSGNYVLYLCTTRDQPITLLFLPIILCCSALKFYLIMLNVMPMNRNYYLTICFLYAILLEQFTTCSRQFLNILF